LIEDERDLQGGFRATWTEFAIPTGKIATLTDHLTTQGTNRGTGARRQRIGMFLATAWMLYGNDS
jgi:hypothetical protein